MVTPPKKTRTVSRSKADRMIATLREKIAASKWSIGDFLPSEAALSEQYGISPNTVRKGLNQLVAEGYIEKVPKIGAKVIAANKAELITLQFGYFTDLMDYEFPFEELVADFYEKHPNIRVHPVDISSRKGEGRIKAQIDRLDVMEVASSFADTLVHDQVLEPLEPKEGLYPFLTSCFESKGKLCAMPYVFTPTILCYNKRHFEEQNIPEPNSSWTWNDVREAGTGLADGKSRFGLYFHVTRDIRWLPFLLQSGMVFERDALGNLNLRDPRLAESMRCIRLLVNDSQLFPTFLGEDEQDEQTLFLRQKVSMVLTTYDRLFTFKDAPFAYDISPLPYLRKPRTLLNTVALAIKSSSRQKEAARLFIDYMLSYKTQLKIRLRTTRIPAFMKAAEWQEDEPQLRRPSRFHMYREIIPTFRYINELKMSSTNLGIMRNELKYYWGGLEELDTVLDRLEQQLNRSVDSP